MKTLELKTVYGGTKSYDVLQDGYAAENYKNAHGTIVRVGKIVGTTGNVGDVKFMSDSFIVERDMNDMDEITDMLKFDGMDISAEVINYYMKSL